MTRAIIDTNILLPSATAGKAEIITNPSNALFTQLIANVNEHASALDTIGAPGTGAPTETKTSGALTLTTLISYVSVTNTVAFTLADGTTVGQRKVIECSAISGTPLGTLTITTADTGGGGAGATHVFTAVGQRLELIWLAGGWHCERKVRAGHQALVIGTTLTAGLDMAYTYDLSVTGTVVSTTTKALPSGIVAGEKCHLDVLTAASTASGTLGFVAMSALGVAVTSAAGIGNSGTDKSFALVLEWSGLEWQICFLGTNTGVTIS
jgi:hypothetical protein